MNRPSTLSTVVSIDLGDLAEDLRERVASGEYESVEAIIHAAVNGLLERESAYSDQDLDELAEQAAAEFDASDGTTYTAKEVFGPIRERLLKRISDDGA